MDQELTRSRADAAAGVLVRAAAGLARAATVLAWVALMLTAGCQRGAVPPRVPGPPWGEETPAAPPEVRCPSFWSAPQEGGTIRLAVQEAVNPAHAPVPINDAERIIFCQTYETLIQADRCGNLRPGLATRWRAVDGGRRWEFELREEARFWDGTPIDRSAVRRAWAAQRRKANAEETRFPWSWIASVSELDPNPRILIVELTVALPSPDLFLHPALAVTLDEGSSAWPLGSGPFRPRPVPSAERPAPGAADQHRLLSFELHPYHPAGQGGECPTWPAALAPASTGLPSVLLVEVSPGADPRDLLAQGADVVWMRRLREIEYARLMRTYAVTALPWDRIYGLVTEPSGEDRPPSIEISRAHLAADAMDSDARAAGSRAFGRAEARAGDGAGGSADDCAAYSLPPQVLGSPRLLPDAVAPGFSRGQLLYDGSDRDAERLAGRLLALDGSSHLDLGLTQVAPVAGDVLRAESGRTGAPACLVRLERALPDPCLEELVLWPWDARRPLVPLVAVRPYLVTRRGLGGVEVLWDGTPLFSAAGWGAPDRDEGNGP